jgi:hypothetical protein
MLARSDCDKICDVIDEEFLNVASALVAEESRRGSSLHSVGLNGGDEFILQPMQVFSRFDYDPREADRRRGDVVILEGLQRPCCGLLFGQNRIRRRKYLVQVVRANELL